jgi:FkbM family methyltransferase
MRVDDNDEVSWSGDSAVAKLFLAYWRRFPQHRGKTRFREWVIRRLFRYELPMRAACGSKIRIDPTDYIGRQIALNGGYEPKSLSLATKLMAGGGVFVDLGSNFGLYTMVLGTIPGVQCIAIDASFAALAKLANNLKLNPGIRATVVASAVSPERALHWFATPWDTNLGATRISERKSNGDGKGFWVAGASLESILKQTMTGKVKLLKADLEGYELKVFQNFDFNGPFRPENILVECDPDEFQGARECFEYLKNTGYSARNVEEKLIDACDSAPEFNVWFQDKRK